MKGMLRIKQPSRPKGKTDSFGKNYAAFSGFMSLRK